ncbi:MAG TPA: divalent metal cation transporter [Dongiaceae bacterium]|nr:divalent metal cation transporter [Dongiaceae bacterium]
MATVQFPDEQVASAEVVEIPATKRHIFPRLPRKTKINRILRILGPGVITGAADDDPSGIATYSQAGAQFGFQTIWSLLLTFPLMVAVQEACMRIGAVTGKGLAAIIRENYSKKLLFTMVALVLIANTFNIGADIGAMASSMQLLLPAVPIGLIAVGFALLIIVLEVMVSYQTYVRILKWLSLALLAYVVTALMVDVPWREALMATIVPHFQFNKEMIFMLVAILGTTISPYLFFWQTSNVVEDEIALKRLAQKGGTPRLSRYYIRKLRIDTVLGMFVSTAVAWFVIVVGAVVLNAGGVTTINTAADAASALVPLVHTFPNAGFIARIIFVVGIVGIGLMSIPVLAGSSSYALAETFNWREGLFRKFKQAREFYLIIIAGTFIGLLINFIGLDPIKTLIISAVVNGIVAVPLIFMILRIVSRKTIMGDYVAKFWSKFGLWGAFIVMFLAAVALIVSLFVSPPS